MDLAGSEGHHGIGSQTEQFRLRGLGGESATECARMRVMRTGSVVRRLVPERKVRRT
jgi:hypothetical protein